MERSAYVGHRTRTRALLAALLGFTLFGALAASAQAVPLSGSASPLPGSRFEGGDGNQVVDNPLNVDWASAVGVRHFADPQIGDQIFKGGSKEDAPALWDFVTQDGGSTPGKNNILDAYALVEESATTGDTFLHLAFTREDATGTTFMAFELNQRADLWDNGVSDTPIPCRTTGDIIVSLQVSGNDPDLILQTWTTTATDPATGCATAGTLTDFTAFVDNVDAQGAVNDAPIANLLPSSFAWPGGVIPANLFVEASLNLTTLLEDVLATPCFSFGSIWMHTRASTSDSSNLDDIVDPEPLLVRTCSASGVKYHDLNADGDQDAGEPGLGGFRIWADYDNDGVRDANEPFDDTDPVTGAYSIANIQDPSGTYSLREQLTPPATGTGGWICSEPTTTGTNGDFECAHTGIDGGTTPNVSGKDFGNYKQATVIVEKQTVPDGAAGSFAFTSTIPGAPSFSLEDGQRNGTELTPGVYTATENAPAGWSLTDITCSGDTIAPNSSDAGATATFNAQSGETITCVFTNTKHATLTIVKDAQPGSAQDFAFTTTGTGLSGFSLDDDADGTLSNTKVFTLSSSQLGSKTITESATAGWTLTDVTCSEGSDQGSTATIQVDPGDAITCTFVNKQDATVTVVKNAVPDSAQDFAFTTTGSQLSGFSLDDDGDGTLSNTKVFTVSGDGFGAKTITESATAGWTLTDVTCSEGSGQGSTATIQVDPGDAITCTFTNAENPGEITVVKQLVPATDAGRFDLMVGDQTVRAAAGHDDSGSTEAAPGTHTVSEAGAGQTDLDLYDSSIACVEGGETIASGDGTELDVEVASDAEIVCTITNAAIPPDLTVVKRIRNVTLGGTFVQTPPAIDAYVGDTLGYQFTVRNTGVVPIAVTVEDPECDAAPVRTSGTGDLLVPGGEWVYECTHLVTAADPDPFPNTVTATGTVPGTGQTVSEKDDAQADIFHPAIDIEKTGPASATQGDLLSYTLAVTNPGDIEFASDKVVVTDPGCDDQPTLASVNGDPSPGTLDPGDTWTYTCSHLTTNEASYTNVATVTGVDRNGRQVSDTDEITTDLAAQLPDTVVNGTARLRGPSGCVKKPFTATVRGTRIARVTFFVDGKRFKRLTAPTAGNRYTVKINPRGRSFGVHRVTARVKFVAGSETPARTLRLSFQRCKRQTVQPRFTG